MEFKVPRPCVSAGLYSDYFDEDDLFLNNISNLPDEKTNTSGKASNSTDKTLTDLNADDFIYTQLNMDKTDPEMSRLNMALVDTEAFADLNSPMPPPPPQTCSRNKRKSIELGSPTTPIQPKRRSLFQCPVVPIAKSTTHWSDNELDDDFFKSQFFKQEVLNAGDKNVFENMTEIMAISQFFPTTQLDPGGGSQYHAPLHLTQMLNDDIAFIDQVEDIPNNANNNCIRITNIRNSNAAVQMAATTDSLSQLFQDEDGDNHIFHQIDVNLIQTDRSLANQPTSAFKHNRTTTDDISFADPPQSSQRFLKEVRHAKVDGLAPPSADVSDPVTVYTSVKNATAYIEMQRDMLEVNEANVGDDNFLDAELSQAYKSTQYRRELEDMFVNCEKTICDANNLKVVTPPENASHLAGLDNMKWSQHEFEENKTPNRPNQTANFKTPLFSPTNYVRQRLDELKNKSISPKVGSGSAAATFRGLGPFFGLPLLVKTLIRDYKGIPELYDWQKECLSLPAIARRNNLIYALPTSGGKTLVSEILILREILCRRKNCLFVLPYVSIVQEKMWAMSPFAVQLDFLLEEYAAGKGSIPPQKRRKKRSIYIATIEKGLALLDSLIETNRANELGLIVVDELHIIGELGRGAALETLLTKAMFIQAGIQIVGMSATIGNLPELAKFLRADVYTRDFRPVELQEFIKCGRDLLQINASPTNIDINDTFRYMRTVEFNYREDVVRRDPDHLAGLVSEVIPEQSVLIFCPTKANCENVAILLSQLLPAKYRDYKSVQREELKTYMEKDGPICPTLARTLPFGIAYHHSGLTGEERRNLEDAFRTNIICVICCTSTLAAGVNLPAKRVILRSPYVGRDFITLSRYKQMVGRAGRAGLCGDVGESILICSPKDNIKVGRLLCSPMDEAASSLHQSSAKGIESMILSAIGLGLAVTRTELIALVDTTLMAIQANRLGINTKEITNEVLAKLFRCKTLSIKSTSFSPNLTLEVDCSTQIQGETSQKATTKEDSCRLKTNVRLKPSTPMEISNMGRASFKSGFDLSRANTIKKDLIQAQQGLVLLNFLHLLYVVTPYEPSDVNVTPTASIYYAQYLRLDKDQMQVATTIGVTESVAMRIMTGKPIKPSGLERIVNRFFFTLILQDLWNQRTVHEVAETFRVTRGIVQNLIVASASFASGVLKFCEELPDFWAFRELLRLLTKRLSYCCTVELIPLMDLPCVKLARAKQLYNAGYKTLEEVAKADVNKLVNDIEHLTTRLARQLISSAKVLLLEKVETLREEVQDCLEVLEGKSTANQT